MRSKKILCILFFCFVINITSNSSAKTFYTGDQVEDFFNYNNDITIKLKPGIWTVVRNQTRGFPKQRIVGIGRVENNEIIEMIEIYEGLLGGYYIKYIEPILIELMFKDEHDGCYERSEYYLIEFYRKGSSFNCMVVRHMDVTKELNYPDSPDGKAAASAYNFWIKSNSLTYPKILLESYHSYFSRMAGGKWYEVRHFIHPKLLNAPKSNFFTEETSEYHKSNISQFPDHKKTMEKWISISSRFHKNFENMSKAKSHHKLALEKYFIEIESEAKSKDQVVDQLKKLNELYKSGALTEEEFVKAKNKILN